MKVLFVCSGNICRSPMAEGYLNSKNIKGLSAISCGFLSAGESVSKNFVLVMNELGIDISAHKSKHISKKLFAADRIYCMSENHRNALVSSGVNIDKLELLGGGIHDPFGQNADVYRACRDEIIAAIDAALYGGKLLPVLIVAADESDAESIAELEKISFSEPWSKTGILASMAHNTTFFKAIYEGRFAGYISVTAVSGEGYINNIAVLPEFKSRGIGSVLLDRAITFAREKKLEFLSLEVRKSNTAAISLYSKLGFKIEGIRRNFYDNPKEDGIIMTRRF